MMTPTNTDRLEPYGAWHRLRPLRLLHLRRSPRPLLLLLLPLLWLQEGLPLLKSCLKTRLLRGTGSYAPRRLTAPCMRPVPRARPLRESSAIGPRSA
jgi:hypothetical protein